jgi:uncharacterized protein YjeT (DUF2065 family)
MIVGRKYWILIWYGILLLGLLGQWASIYWARRTRWQNMDEVLRAFGTILVSAGMLILLYQPDESLWSAAATVLLLDALLCFVAAFILGRRAERRRAAHAAARERAAILAEMTRASKPNPVVADAELETEVSRDTSRTSFGPHRS